MDNPYEAAKAFAIEFGQTEYALKRSGYLRKNRDVAEADWDTFARDLGVDFFSAIVSEQVANTLIGEPPRRLLATMEWSPRKTAPLTSVQELIVQGVWRVRKSFLHGEKFTGGPEGQWDRDTVLI